MINTLAGVPLTIKSLAWTVTGSIGSLTSIMKSVGGTTTIIPHIGLFTVQPEGVGVGLGGTVAVGVGEAVAVAVAVGVGVGPWQETSVELSGVPSLP